MAEYDSGLEAARREAMAQWCARWSAHDAQGVRSLFTDRFAYEDVPTHRVSRTTDEFVTFAREIFAAASDVRYDIQAAFLADERGCAEWTMQGTNDGAPATHRQFRLKGVSVFEFEGEKIAKCSDYWCLATLIGQLQD